MPGFELYPLQGIATLSSLIYIITLFSHLSKLFFQAEIQRVASSLLLCYAVITGLAFWAEKSKEANYLEVISIFFSVIPVIVWAGIQYPILFIPHKSIMILVGYITLYFTKQIISGTLVLSVNNIVSSEDMK